MKKILRLTASVILAFIIAAAPARVFAVEVTSTQLVNAATYIIVDNEGSYTTIVRNDNGAVSIGKMQWHATRALDLLKRIAAANPTQAANILGASLYNEVVTYTSWDTRIFTYEEASVTERLLGTAESVNIQNALAEQEIIGYINHGISLGVTAPDALVFFADYENQAGYGGASSFVSSVKSATGNPNPSLYDLYANSSQNSRRRKVYNFCVSLNWSSFNQSPAAPAVTDNVPPVIANVRVLNVTGAGYMISFSASDDVSLGSVYVASYYTADGEGAQKWQSLNVVGVTEFTAAVRASDYGGRSGYYTTVIYAYDTTGNYAYAALNPVWVGGGNQQPSGPTVPGVKVTAELSSPDVGADIRFKASVTPAGPYNYTFRIIKDGVLIKEQMTGGVPYYTLQNASAGTYSAEVSAENAFTGEVLTGSVAGIGLYEEQSAEPTTFIPPEVTTAEVVSRDRPTAFELLTGDADGDGKVTAADARIVLRVSARLETLDPGRAGLCDLDDDGKITAADARTVLRISARLEAVSNA